VRGKPRKKVVFVAFERAGGKGASNPERESRLGVGLPLLFKNALRLADTNP